MPRRPLQSLLQRTERSGRTALGQEAQMLPREENAPRPSEGAAGGRGLGKGALTSSCQHLQVGTPEGRERTQSPSQQALGGACV